MPVRLARGGDDWSTAPWRAPTWRKRHSDGWGLAWFLAGEICSRFYSSHGIVPHVIEHEGLGYYGLRLDRVPCLVNGAREHSIGRITASGDVERWTDGEMSESRRISLVERAANGEDLFVLLQAAIKHLDLAPLPSSSHYDCRHKRWGDSYTLIFHLAAQLALRADRAVTIWNHSFHTARLAREMDADFDLPEHPGHFLISGRKGQVLIAGDGRVLVPTNERSLWRRYMEGESPDQLTAWLLKRVGPPQKHKGL